jgi:cobalt-zinc-cadmium efflux system membrane fusion protein
MADEEKVMKIFPLAGGTVMDVSVELGDYVEKDKVLAVIKSSEVAEYQNQLDAAQANLKIAQKNADASEDMYKSKLISEKEYITAQNELQKSKAEVTRLNEVFNIYSVGKNSEYIIKAPIAGYVVEKKINRDMKIRADLSDNIFTISELSDVWVVANVYESDISNIKLGYDADITTLSYPDKTLHGKVDKIFTVLDPISKVMKIRVKLDNEDNMLKPEMFAYVTVSSAEDKSFPCILSRAVIFDKSKNFVMVYHDPSHIETREIEIYKTSVGTTYIKHGLAAGEQVISQGHMLIYDQLND